MNRLFFIITFIAFSLTACKTTQEKTAEDLESVSYNINGIWELASQTNIENLEKNYPNGLPRITIEEEEKGLIISGFDGCNTFTEKAKVKRSNQLAFEKNGISTLMACEKVDNNEFNNFFNQSKSFEITENTLTIVGDGGVLKFHRIALNGKWFLDKIYTTKKKVAELYPYKKPFINIDINSPVMTGNSACNNISGQLLIYQNTMKFNHLMTTKMYCDGINEKIFIDALGVVTHYRLEGMRLILLENDKPVVELIRIFE